MGNLFSCVDDVPDLQRLEYDMTPIKDNLVPVIWLVGPPGSGRTTQADMICEAYCYEQIKIAELLLVEATKETDRGRVIRESLDNSIKRVPDTMVIDLIKEEMLQRAAYAYGFLLNGFPRTENQAIMFSKEIGNVDVVIILTSDINSMVERTMMKLENGNPEAIKLNIAEYVKEMKMGTSKYGTKTEKILSHLPPEEVFEQIQEAINVRLNLQTQVITNTKKVLLNDMELVPL